MPLADLTGIACRSPITLAKPLRPSAVSDPTSSWRVFCDLGLDCSAIRAAGAFLNILFLEVLNNFEKRTYEEINPGFRAAYFGEHVALPNLTPAPEPPTASLVVLAFGALVWVQRLRRHH